MIPAGSRGYAALESLVSRAPDDAARREEFRRLIALALSGDMSVPENNLGNFPVPPEAFANVAPSLGGVGTPDKARPAGRPEYAVFRSENQVPNESQPEHFHLAQSITGHGWKRQGTEATGKESTPDERKRRTRKVATPSDKDDPFSTPEDAAWAWKERVWSGGVGIEASAMIYQRGKEYLLTETVTQDYSESVYPEYMDRPGNVVAAVHNHPRGVYRSPRPGPSSIPPRPIFTEDDYEMGKRYGAVFVVDPKGKLIRWSPRREGYSRIGMFGSVITRKDLKDF